MKTLAVNEIMSIYEKNSHMLKETIEALGQAGGEEAIKNIIAIYSKNTYMLKETINALGQAGKNSKV